LQLNPFKHEFTALPGGFWFEPDQSFHNLFDNGYWWTSTEQASTSYVWYRELYMYEDMIVHYTSPDKNYGSSVRCLKD
jgi:uncharacterized protein (TIGR02145 family)